MFSHAEQEMMFLADMKDKSYQEWIENHFLHLLEPLVKSQRLLMVVKPELKFIIRLYFYSTSLLVSPGILATYGETFTNLISVKNFFPSSERQTLISTKQRLIFILLICFLPYLNERILELNGWSSLLSYLSQKQQSRKFVKVKQNHSFLERLKARLWLIIKAIFKLLPLLEKLHLILFFFNSEYVNIFYRLSKISLISTNSRYEKDKKRVLPLQFLSFLSLFELVCSGLRTGLEMSLNLRQPVSREVKNYGRPDKSCGICLSEPIENPAHGKCGHVFCYHCLLGTSLAKEICPLCRKKVRPQDIRCIYF